MRRLSWVLLVLIIILGLWYFLIKDYNYRISFKSEHPPGTIYSTLKNLNSPALKDVDSVQLKEFEAYSDLNHSIFLKDSIFDFEWEIQSLGDSKTRVVAKIKDRENSFQQNLKALYTKNDFVNRNISLVKEIMEGLYKFESDYKVNIEEDANAILDKQFCAYVSIESKTFDKGAAMMRNISTIMSYINEQEIPLLGDPFLQITSWDKEAESVTYDFCFPINPSNSYPDRPGIKFKYASEIRGLKAIFNGNYKLSNNAWYEMMDHAEENGYELEGYPLEIYRNDPHGGGNELEWVAEIYWAIKDPAN